MRFECPKLRGGAKGQSSGSQVKKEVAPKVPGRAFQMTTDTAKETIDVVSGTFLLNSMPASVLFDSGADYSFVSSSFYKSLNVSSRTLSDSLVIEVENGEQVIFYGM